MLASRLTRRPDPEHWPLLMKLPRPFHRPAHRRVDRRPVAGHGPHANNSVRIEAASGDIDATGRTLDAALNAAADAIRFRATTEAAH